MRASVTLDNINLSEGYTGGAGTRLGGGGSIALVNGLTSSYEQIYRSQLWVSVVVNRLARGVGRIPWASYTSSGEPGERERQRDTPLAQLLERPWRLGPSNYGTPARLKQAIVWNMCIHGNSVLVKSRPRPSSPPTMLIPSNGANWRITVDDNGWPEWYWYLAPNRRTILKYRPEEVVHLRWETTGTEAWARSPLEPLASTLAIEDAANRAIKGSYEKGLRPSGAFVWDTKPGVQASVITKQMEEARAQLEAEYGGVDNTGSWMLLAGGMDWKTISNNLVDSEVIATKKLTREEVAAAYNVPPPVIGILDRATFSNIDEQHRMEYQDTMHPYLELIEEELEAQLIADEPAFRGEYVEFNIKEILRGDPAKELQTLIQAAGGPILTPNESRRRINEPPVDGGDELRTAQGAAPGLNGRPMADDSEVK